MPHENVRLSLLPILIKIQLNLLSVIYHFKMYTHGFDFVEFSSKMFIIFLNQILKLFNVLYRYHLALPHFAVYLDFN